MIRTFANKQTRELWLDGRARKVPSEVVKRARRKLALINEATAVEQLVEPPGNRLHALAGNRKGQHAIAVNNQWRICFRFEGKDAYDVEFCDYH
ncbi:MAG: type II toxin-antitoxin system RelE/ParE family toxin [Coriobacteriia bacterium]|nr:type II toxin-antitoxin system RelE/ParE family toxin [Coriobacteriia bacterium]